MAPLGAGFDLNIRGFGQALGGPGCGVATTGGVSSIRRRTNTMSTTVVRTVIPTTEIASGGAGLPAPAGPAQAQVNP
jgi:hypothetical protein